MGWANDAAIQTPQEDDLLPSATPGTVAIAGDEAFMRSHPQFDRLQAYRGEEYG